MPDDCANMSKKQVTARKDDINLHDIIDAANPDCIYAEVKHIARSLYEDFDFGFLDQAYKDICRLFRGKYPGYRRSTTKYHDLRHTLEVFLCTARLLHGAVVEGVPLSMRNLELGLISALMHDTGLLQTEDDTEGTGAKYTVGHEKRSVNFLTHYFAKHGRTGDDRKAVDLMITSTNLSVSTQDLTFPGKEIALAAKVMATADLLAQMADREYLEKLLLLYLEFQEAGLPYESMYELLSKTHGFYAMARNRLAVSLDGVSAYMLPHFKARWGLDRDLYNDSMEKNMDYLDVVLKEGEKNFLNRLKRGNIHEKLLRLEAI